MTVDVIWSEQARQELFEACRWYGAREPLLDAKLVEKVRRVVAFISRHPHASVSFNDRYRKAVVPGFPYCLIYSLSGSVVQVVAFWPDRRDPATLQEIVGTDNV